MEEDQRELLITTLIKFIDRLAKLEKYPKIIVTLCLEIIKEDMEKHIHLYIRNSGYFKTYLNKVAELPEYKESVENMTIKLLWRCIDYWENTSKVEEWFEKKQKLFKPQSSEKIKDIGGPFFEKLRAQLDQAQDWAQLRELFFYNDIANYFRRFTEEFDTTLEKIYYLYFLLHIPGMEQLKIICFTI